MSQENVEIVRGMVSAFNEVAWTRRGKRRSIYMDDLRRHPPE